MDDTALPTAPEALEHMAELTRSRDRERVDASLMSALLDLLPLQQVVIWRVIGEVGTPQYWLRCGAQRRGELVPTTEGQFDDLSDPPPLETHPQHARCYLSVRLVQSAQPDGVLVLLPMASEREVEGVVEMRADAPLDAAGERLARGMLKIHRNFISLLDYSERDTLTGLLNRKGFDETFLRASVIEAQRLYGAEDSERRLAARRHFLGVIDIDHFKRVNDQFGHLIGDEVLVLVARIMRSTFRYDDRLYRFGGEEFVVLVSTPDDDTAGQAFERLRANIEGFVFPRVGRVTISVGYSDVRPGDTPQAAFERADRSVYHGKEQGRNQVCSYARLIEQGVFTEVVDENDIELF
ncbi:MAG: GGDEF domain-containing protein [Leptothrix sp. (in: b-proteobacteria)]